MQKISLIAVLIVVSASATYAVPMGTLEYGTVPQREYTPTQDECLLRYYNICSGWLYCWSAYCYPFEFNEPMYGTSFDLADCPADCRHLEDVWFACRANVIWGTVDVEIYCADEYSCPVGAPLAGIYGVGIPYGNPWMHFDFGGLSLCACEEEGAGKFIVMITEPWAGIEDAPYSDVNSYNLNDGCETEWRCTGHSYVYCNVVDYCGLYGMPNPLWVAGADYGCTDHPPIPPGCYDMNGFYAEWLIDCYLSSEGPTATEKTSWSEIKGLYR